MSEFRQEVAGIEHMHVFLEILVVMGVKQYTSFEPFVMDFLQGYWWTGHILGKVLPRFLIENPNAVVYTEAGVLPGKHVSDELFGQQLPLCKEPQDSAPEVLGHLKIVIFNPADVVKLVGPRLNHKQKEHFLILSLDTRNTVKKISEITVGILDSSLIHPREVFKEAIQSLASSVILVHNHPSGNPNPSEADIEITKKMVKTGSREERHARSASEV